MTSVVLPWARVEWGYDAAGRVISEGVNGRAVQSVFNAAGERVESFTPSGVRTSLSYDRRGLVESLSTAGRRCEITTDEWGRATRLQYGTSAVDSAFDTVGRLVERRVLAGVRDLSVLNLGGGSASPTELVAGRRTPIGLMTVWRGSPRPIRRHPLWGRVYLPRGSNELRYPNPDGMAVHSRVHTNYYYDAVNEALLQAANREEAVRILDEIRTALQRGGYP